MLLFFFPSLTCVYLSTQSDCLGTKTLIGSRKIQINLALPFPCTVIFLSKARRILFSVLLLPLLPSAKSGLSACKHTEAEICAISAQRIEDIEAKLIL